MMSALGCEKSRGILPMDRKGAPASSLYFKGGASLGFKGKSAKAQQGQTRKHEETHWVCLGRGENLLGIRTISILLD